MDPRTGDTVAADPVRPSGPRSGRALLVWTLLVVAANLRSGLTGVGPLLDRLQADLGLQPAVAGLLNAVPLLLFAAVSPFVPGLAARWGPERLLGGALAVLAAGILVRSVPVLAAPPVFVGTCLIGAGIAVGNVILPGLIKRDFPDRIGLLTGAYATVMGGVAAVVSGVVVPISEMAPGGWRTALGCWVVLTVLALAGWLPRLRVRQRTAASRRRQRLPWSSPLAWAVTAFLGLQSLGFYVVITWLPQVVRAQGLTATDAGWLLFGYQAVAVVTGLAVPLALRRGQDQRAVAIGSSALLLTAYAGLLVAPGQAWLWTVVLGLGGGASLVLALAFLSLRAADPAAAGALSAMAQSVGYLLAAAGPVIFGMLHTASGGWRLPVLLLCCAAAGQLASAFVAGSRRQTG